LMNEISTVENSAPRGIEREKVNSDTKSRFIFKIHTVCGELRSTFVVSRYNRLIINDEIM
jgi:hypothetical protein